MNTLLYFLMPDDRTGNLRPHRNISLKLIVSKLAEMTLKKQHGTDRIHKNITLCDIMKGEKKGANAMKILIVEDEQLLA